MSTRKKSKNKISEYVSNTNKDIYAIKNLPEEVISVIFAYVSRSPKSFRDNLLKVIEEGDYGEGKASKFHEKWVLNYGHSSVAEHSYIHLGIENVSRLFSAELELSNPYLSFTEYSQRYQRPTRDNIYIPEELNSTQKKRYKEFQNYTFDCYENIYNKLLSYLKDTYKKNKEETDKAYNSRIEKIAFEDARYVLSLGTTTNLGMSGNARAVEDSLKKLFSSRYSEVRRRAEDIKKESQYICPTLIKYAKESPYLKYLDSLDLKLKDKERKGTFINNDVHLLDYTGSNVTPPSSYAYTLIVNCLNKIKSIGESSYINSYSMEVLEDTFDKIVHNMEKHDNPHEVFNFIDYVYEMTISEACWHQLLRHRRVNWLYSQPTIDFGVVYPPNILNAKCNTYYRDIIKESSKIYWEFVDNGLEDVAPYVVLNCHKRKIIGKFSLWEFYHLIKLRGSSNAQWEIRDLIVKMLNLIMSKHGKILDKAIEHSDLKK